MIFQCLSVSFSSSLSPPTLPAVIRSLPFSINSPNTAVCCALRMFYLLIHTVVKLICFSMDRMNEDYCLLVCDAVYDSNFFLRASFILVTEVADTSETLMSGVTELILFTVVDRCILGL